MLKKMLPFIGVLVFALSLVACQAAPTAAPAQTTAEAPTAVTTAMPGMGNGAGNGPATGRGQGAMHGQEAHDEDEHGGPPEGMNPAENIPTPSDTNLTDAEKADLLHMREEEKLARDVYLTLYDKWGAQVFSNIARSEQMHMDAVGTLLQRYGLDDPVAQTNDARGVFNDPKLQDLYNQLVEKGSTSLVDALTVGATIEDLDIKDLDEAIARTTHADIQTVYERLREGSYHHMKAFVSNLRANGADYSPQFISAEEFQHILESTPGGPAMGGQGAGRGRGGEMGHGAGGPHGNCQATATPAP